MARASATRILPLLVWQQQGEIARLAEERDQLAKRIARLQPHAHYRLELEARMRALTSQQLELERLVFGGRQ